MYNTTDGICVLVVRRRAHDFIREEGVVCETAGEVYFRCRLGWMRSVIYRGARELLLLQYIEVDVPGVELF